MLTEIENPRREAAAHREARAVAAVAEGELHALRSELAFVRAEAGSLRQQRDAFRQERAQARELFEMRVATWRMWLTSKAELQRKLGEQAELHEALAENFRREGHDHVRGILLEIAAVFGRVDDLDTLPARQREAVARDNHVRGLLLEIAAVFGSIDDLDTLPARVREAAARGSS